MDACNIDDIRDGCHSANKVIAAGKNFASFDQKFLEKLPNWNVNFAHRVIDPAMLYFKPFEDDKGLPSTKICMERAGITAEVAHTAVEDAIVVVDLIRRAYGNHD